MDFSCESEVGNFGYVLIIPLVIYQYVFRLEVSVDVVLLVDLAKTIADVFHDTRRHLF
jgi:hypothetical protein